MDDYDEDLWLIISDSEEPVIIPSSVWKPSKDSPGNKTSKDSSENKTSKDSPENKTSKDSSENKTSKHSPDNKTSKDSSENKTSKHSPENKASRDSPENKTSKDSTGNKTSKDSPKNSQKNSEPKMEGKPIWRGWEGGGPDHQEAAVNSSDDDSFVIELPSDSGEAMDSDYFSQTQSGLTESQSRVHCPRTAGTIHKIQMKNFMCHDNLEVKLNPRINFIIGKNGSGKSAIQTAIAVGLGCKALATNRGSSIKALIKNDKSSCTISIVINNQGESAYQPDTYGSYIRVERMFSQSAGSYKIKDDNGKVVSDQKKELERIVNHFNIQPENPLCILQQDMARNFLNSSDPKKKYMFYMKASRLGDISKLYNESICRVHTVKEILDNKFQSVGEAFHDVLKMRENLKIMEDAKKKRETCENLEKELLWAEVNDCNSELKRLQKKLESENQAMQNLQQQLKDLQESNGDEKLRELESKLEEMDGMVEDARRSLELAKRKHAEKKGLYAQSVGKFREARENMKSKKYKYESCLAEIDKLVKGAPEIQQKQERLKEELNRQKQELDALKAAETTAEHDKQQLNDTVDVSRQNLQACDQKLGILRSKKAKTADQLKHLSQSTSNLSIYGEAIVAVVEEVERAASQRKFSQKPVGPIGRHISVREPQWAAAVEHFLNKGFLSTFCVDNAKDSAALSQIMRTVCSRYRTPPPSIICSKFLPRMHNISGSETGTRQYRNLARALDIDNPVVANCLIDQLEAETVLLIPSNNEAYQLLDEEHKVPRNCKKAFTLTGDQFIPAPNYKSYSAMRPVTRATLLQAKQEELVREFTNEVSKLTQEISEAEKEKQKVQQQLGEISNSMRRSEQELRNIKKRKFDTEQRIRQIEEEINDSENQTNQTNKKFLEEESKVLKREYEKESEKSEELKSECERAKADFEEARSDYEQHKCTIEESNRQKAPVQGEIQRLRSIMQEASSKADLINHRIRDQANKVEKTESKIKEVKKELATTRENASQTCDEEVETNRSRDEIEKELNTVKTYLKSLEDRLGGSVDVLQDNLRKRQHAFDTVTNDLNELRSLMKKSLAAIQERRTKQNRLQRIMMSSAKHNFQIALKERNFEGKLEFDVMNETLEIKVSRPQHDVHGQAEKRLDTSSLSGGEKSYSTVCFIMALWHEIELPFHFMDEFDVFMDGINRKVVIDMLLGHANNINQQFVFLTPLDASSIPQSEQITIHRLEAPRK